MKLTFVTARPDDLPRVAAFYKDVILKTDMEHTARWSYGFHPDDEMLKLHITEGSLVMAMIGETIVSSMAQSPYQEAEYRLVPWAETLPDEQVSVVHLLCVHPDFVGQGIGRAMLEHAMTRARAMGKKSLRLDCLSTNTSANAIYEHLGFSFRGTQQLPAANLGSVVFRYYEYPLA